MIRGLVGKVQMVENNKARNEQKQEDWNKFQAFIAKFWDVNEEIEIWIGEIEGNCNHREFLAVSLSF
jgi:hypothetical protein